MKGSFKLFKVCMGFFDEDGKDVPNWRSETVIAHDAVHAVKRARLRANEFAESVELISYIDKP